MLHFLCSPVNRHWVQKTSLLHAYPETKLLAHMVILFLISRGMAMQFPIVAPVLLHFHQHNTGFQLSYTPTDSTVLDGTHPAGPRYPSQGGVRVSMFLLVVSLC